MFSSRRDDYQLLRGVPECNIIQAVQCLSVIVIVGIYHLFVDHPFFLIEYYQGSRMTFMAIVKGGFPGVTHFTQESKCT